MEDTTNKACCKDNGDGETCVVYKCKAKSAEDCVAPECECPKLTASEWHALLPNAKEIK